MDSVRTVASSATGRSLAQRHVQHILPAARAFRAGRLSDAFLLLERERVPFPLTTRSCSLNCLYLRGQSSRATEEAEARLASPGLPIAHKSRYLSVLAAVQVDQGELEAAMVSGRQAMVLADQAGDPALAAVTAALLLERSCDRTGFDASLPMATQVRRRAVRCTDLQVRATIHLTFGRLEGRVGHLHTALRHFAVGRQLVSADPNQLIASSLDLDESSVLSLLGDVPGALEMAQRAARSADESGWAKGKSVAVLNVAQFWVLLAALAEADVEIQRRETSQFIVSRMTLVLLILGRSSHTVAECTTLPKLL